QAEDGIRDRTVTGVQTCALPICPVFPAMSFVPARITATLGARLMTSARNRTSICGVVCPSMPRFRYPLPGNQRSRSQCSVIESRSEERRVGRGLDRLLEPAHRDV